MKNDQKGKNSEEIVSDFEKEYSPHKVIGVEEQLPNPKITWQDKTFEDFSELFSKMNKEDQGTIQSMISLLTGNIASSGFRKGFEDGKRNQGQQLLDSMSFGSRRPYS